MKFKPDRHVDHQWCMNKIDGHGGGIIYTRIPGFILFSYCGGKSRFTVMIYNLILIVRFLVRKASRQKHSL